jgi:hypothetical protein
MFQTSLCQKKIRPKKFIEALKGKGKGKFHPRTGHEGPEGE